MASQTSRLYGNVKNIAKMTTLRDRHTVQTNARTLSTEKYINKLYTSTLQHVNHRITTDTTKSGVFLCTKCHFVKTLICADFFHFDSRLLSTGDTTLYPIINQPDKCFIPNDTNITYMYIKH